MRARRCLLLVLLLSSAWPALAAEPGLPQRVLQIEWRVVERSAPPAVADSGDPRTVVIGTTGQFDARPSVTVRTAPRPDDAATPKRLRVLNGHAARLALSQPEQLQSVQLFRGPKGDGGVVQPVWVERVDALSVRPRWAGGKAPVIVEVAAEMPAASDAAASQAGAARWQASTTLPFALGDWVPVARTGSPGTLASPGVLSSQDVQRSVSRELQLRVTAPQDAK